MRKWFVRYQARERGSLGAYFELANIVIASSKEGALEAFCKIEADIYEYVAPISCRPAVFDYPEIRPHHIQQD